MSPVLLPRRLTAWPGGQRRARPRKARTADESLGALRQRREQMGALSTVAILDLQLAAAFTCRWELDTCDAHAQAAVGLAARLGLEQVRAKALAVLAGSASMRADAGQT